MKERIVVMPVEVDRDGKPLNDTVYARYVSFCEKEWGAIPDVRLTLKTWVAIREHPELGTYEEAVGVLALQYQLVCPTFHVTKPAAREDVPKVVLARDGLIARARSFAQDNGLSAGDVHVYCAPEAQEIWKSFLEQIGAKSSNLFTVPITA